VRSGTQLRRLHRQDLQPQVDSIEQRPGKLRLISALGHRRAGTFDTFRDRSAAGARIGRQYELEPGRQRCTAGRALELQYAVFERLTQRVEDPPIELWRFVEEKHAAVGPRRRTR